MLNVIVEEPLSSDEKKNDSICIICCESKEAISNKSSFFECKCVDCNFHEDCWKNYICSKDYSIITCPCCRTTLKHINLQMCIAIIQN